MLQKSQIYTCVIHYLDHVSAEVKRWIERQILFDWQTTPHDQVPCHCCQSCILIGLWNTFYMQMDLLLQIHIKGNKHLLSYGLDLKVIPTYILLQINYMSFTLSLISLNSS